MFVLVLLYASYVCSASAQEILVSPPPHLNTEDLLQDVKPLKILLITGYFPGHLFPIVSLGEELVQRGHDVTLCSTVMDGSNLLPEVPQRVGVKFISAGADDLTQKMYDDMNKGLGQLDLEKTKDVFSYSGLTIIKIRKKIDSIGYHQFDIVVCDYSTTPLAVYYSKLGMKVVVFSSLAPMFPAAIPEWPCPVTSSGMFQDMSFLQRLTAVLLQPLMFTFTSSIFNKVLIDEKFKETIADSNILMYPGAHVPVIITTVVGFDIPKTDTPLMHYVGPIRMKALHELSENLKEWLHDKSKRSVIYISMGTTGILTHEDVEALVNGIMCTEYDVVWALRSSNQEVLDQIRVDSKRFYIAEWVSQQKLLKHEAIALAILHCGMNGVQEALSNAIPVICIAHAYDQYDVGTRVVEANVGFSLFSIMDSIYYGRVLSSQTITDTILALNSSLFRDNAKLIQKMYQLAGGATRAAKLIEFYEYVGYEHLIPAYVKYSWTWIQYYNVDVYLTLVLTFIVALLLLYNTLALVVRIIV